MLSRTELTNQWKAASALLILLLLSITACRNTPPKEVTTQAQPAAPNAQAAGTVPPAPKVAYHPDYDAQIKEIMKLAGDDRWEEAEAKATELRAHDPNNPLLERVHTWTLQEMQRRRQKALEDKIREIDSKHSVFNPTVKSLLEEKKDRGLPASKDVRDVISRIESAPYIPETYGKIVQEKGPLFDLESTKGKMARVLDKQVTIHLDNVPLEAILVNLSQTAGVNIIADKSVPALKQVLSVNLEKVKLEELLRYIGRNYDLQFQVGDELVWVVDAKDPKRLMEETRFYRLRKGFVLPAQFGSEDVNRAVVTVNNVSTTTETTKVKRFVNDEAPPVPMIEKAIKELFTGSKFMVDYERNLVVAKGTPEQLAVIEQILEEFDRPIQQVLIEARFVTLTKPAFLQLGVLWETMRPQSAARTPTDYTGMVGSQSLANVGVGIQETFTNILGSDDLSATITALEQTGESQTLSAPRLTVLNNRAATISDGKVQYYYEEYTVKSTVQQYYTSSSFVPAGKPTKITAGAELSVLASISGDGRHILLALNPRVNTDVQMVRYTTLSETDPVNGRVINKFDINLPQYRTQELATRVVVRSGETVVMGGVLERDRTTYVESVPVLGDIPVIGALFRRRTEVDKPRYLLVFVTATIVKDSGEFLTYEDEESQSSGNGAARAPIQPARTTELPTLIPAPAAAPAGPAPTPSPAPATPAAVVPAEAAAAAVPAPVPAPALNPVPAATNPPPAPPANTTPK